MAQKSKKDSKKDNKIKDKMQILKSKVMGYCMGVKKAINTANTALLQYKDKKVFTLGPLIHNSTALKTLEKQGLCVLEQKDICKLDKNCVVIIRAHGVSPFVMQDIKKTGAKIIDATCPRVMLSQKKAFDYAKQGYNIFIAGDKNHAEVQGIEGFAKQGFLQSNIAGGLCCVVSNQKEALSTKKTDNKAIVLCQTTIGEQEYQKIVFALQQRLNNLTVLKTICPATEQRQQALKELKSKAQGILVIGSKDSSNTKRLFLIAKSLFKKAHLIQNQTQIPPEYFNLDTVAITAGASTLDIQIQDVIKALQKV